MPPRADRLRFSLRAIAAYSTEVALNFCPPFPFGTRCSLLDYSLVLLVLADISLFFGSKRLLFPEIEVVSVVHPAVAKQLRPKVDRYREYARRRHADARLITEKDHHEATIVEQQVAGAGRRDGFERLTEETGPILFGVRKYAGARQP